nr:thiamine pyrophosphate-dependent enzyme [Bradyrhizobium valentinum]
MISNKQSYGTIRSHQERAFPKRPWGTDLSNPDFAALPRAFGARGCTITNAAQAAEVFAEAMSANGPVVIEVRSDVRQTIDRSLVAASGCRRRVADSLHSRERSNEGGSATGQRL